MTLSSHLSALRLLLTLLGCLSAWLTPDLLAQRRYPANDSAGIAGTVPNSYVIAWEPTPGAVGYDYVVSDNPLCFSGCAGDTREAFVRDTTAVEYDLQLNHRYYWIFRTHLANGDTSAWTLIYSFTTRETDFTRRMVVLAPNPIARRQIRLRMDWAQKPRASEVYLTLIGAQGQTLRRQTFRARREFVRYGYLLWPAADLAPGRYLLRVEIAEHESPRLATHWLTLIVP